MRPVATAVTLVSLVMANVPAPAAAEDEGAPVTSPPATAAATDPSTSTTTVAAPPAATSTSVAAPPVAAPEPPPAPPTADTAPTTAATTETTTTTTTTTVETTTTTIAPAGQQVLARPNHIEYILATIRHLESGGNYEAPPNRAGASGAYQYIPLTWAQYGGYEEAYLAPPWVQDQRAQADVEAILRTYGNDVSMVPIIWYFPAAARDATLLDTVPKPHLGNVLTIREYQRRWLDTLVFIAGRPLPPRFYPLPPGLELLSGIPPVVPAPGEPGQLSVAFPLLGPAVVAPPPPCATEACDGADPAIVFGRKLQPVLAAADGVVTDVELADPVTGEVSVTITDVQGRSYRYAGLNDDTRGTDDGAAPEHLRVTALARVGRTVRAGQVIGLLGNSDATTLADGSGAWPHLRLTVTDLDGTALDAEGAVVTALFRQSCTTGIGPWSVPPRDGTSGPGGSPIEPVKVPADDRGGVWTITATGQVTAVGDAALLNPNPGCQWRPDIAFGPGAGGNAAVPDGFWDPIELPVKVWLAAAHGGDVRPTAPMRRP